MAFGWLGDAVGLAANAVGIFNNLRKPDQPAALGDMQRSAQLYRQISNALMQPDLGRYSGLVDAEQEGINREASQALRDLMLADRMSRTRSASGLGVFQSDRRDETIARALQQTRDQSRQMARERARNYLTQALTGAQVQMGAYGNIGNIQIGLNDQQYQRQNRAFEQMTYIPDMLNQVFGSKGTGTSRLLDGTPTTNMSTIQIGGGRA